MPTEVVLTHSERVLSGDFGQAVIYLSHTPAPRRLVVFVHGFRGQPVGSWDQFSDSGRTREWWRASDMLFVGYDSTRHTIKGVADDLRHRLPMVYPTLPEQVLLAGDAAVRPFPSPSYRELLLVGHSAGGPVLRQALADAVLNWEEARATNPDAPPPAFLRGELRLFSPATGGMRAAGLLGLARATPGVATAFEMLLRRSSFYVDLQPLSSPFLPTLQSRTEELSRRHPDLPVLRARTLWANPEDVVLPQRYDTDPVDDSMTGKDHRSVCKPHASYAAPWVFVETGRSREY